MKEGQSATVTGGRAATMRHIPPRLALAVGKPSVPPPAGWRWVRLTDVARLESGHTPSRRHPEWWGGEIPWLSLKDAKVHHGGRIADTFEHTNELGIANSSARVLPADTVCLSRTASVGYVVVMDRPMATSQDFVSWVCSDEIEPDFLKYLLLAEGSGLLRFAAGSVHSTIYFPEVKAFHAALPPRSEQGRITEILDHTLADVKTARENAEKNLRDARAVFESHADAILSDPGDDWARTPLSELCDIKHGFAFKSEFFTDAGDAVLLTPGNFFEAGGYRDRGSKQKYYCGDVPPAFVLSAGDLLVAMTEQAAGLLGSPILVPGTGTYLHNQRLGLVTGRPGVPWSNEFFFRVFNTPAVRKELHDSASGTKVRHTSPTKIGAVVVAYPKSLEEQARIVAQLNAMAAETACLETSQRRKLAALDELKQSLLHDAFEGNI